MPAKVPAMLTRSLDLLEALIADPLPRTYGQIRSRINAGDASLARLLGHLVSSGILERGRARTYVPGLRLERWKERMSRPLAPTAWDGRLQRLSRETGLSSAVAVMEVNKILIHASVSLPETVSVLPAGGLIHFERDHAAALAILSQCTAAAARELIAGEFSKIPTMAVLRHALSKFGKANGFLDRSRERPGVSRLAVPIRSGGAPGALYVVGSRREILKRAPQLMKTLEGLLSRGP